MKCPPPKIVRWCGGDAWKSPAAGADTVALAVAEGKCASAGAGGLQKLCGDQGPGLVWEEEGGRDRWPWSLVSCVRDADCGECFASVGSLLELGNLRKFSAVQMRAVASWE